VLLTRLYRREPQLKKPYDTNLAALIAEPSLTALVGPVIVAKARFVKETGNRAVHDMRPVSEVHRGFGAEGTASHLLLASPHLCSGR